VLLSELKFQILYEQRRFDEAEREVRKNILAEPLNPEHQISLAQVGFMMGSDSLAIASLEQALLLEPSNLRTLLSLASIYRKRGDFDRYFSILRRLFIHPDYPFEEKVNIHTDNTKELDFYRRYYLQIGSLTSLLEKHYPTREEAVRLHADHLIKIGEIEQMLNLYKRHLGDQPPVKSYYEEVIGVENYLERPDSVNHYMEEAIRIFPKDVSLRLLRGHLAAIQKQDYRRAIAHYKEVFRLDANDSLRSVVWGLIGDLYQQEANEEITPQALQSSTRQRAMKRCYAAYNKALKYNPDNISVMNNYAYYLSLEEHDLEHALRLSSRVMELEGENPTYMDTHAWVLFKLGRLEEARQLLRKAVSLDGQKNPDLQVHYGDVLAALGEGFMAQTYWKRALENGYNSEEIVRRIEQLKNRSITP
jgi:tetratricopeptide (TPR) repeat protein